MERFEIWLEGWEERGNRGGRREGTKVVGFKFQFPGWPADLLCHNIKSSSTSFDQAGRGML
eukprot:scaffold275_cov236-Chaetoceros_neogracile.AAC.8